MTHAQEALFNEARRTVVGLTAARLREDVADADRLYDAYFTEARRLGVSTAVGWSLLASATQTWVTQLVTRLATASGTEDHQILLEMSGTEGERVIRRG